MTDPRGVDVDLNVFFRILGFEEQELGHEGVCHLIIDSGAQEDDPFAQQARIDVEGTLALPDCSTTVGSTPGAADGITAVGRMPVQRFWIGCELRASITRRTERFDVDAIYGA